MATNEQRREAAKRKLDRQLQHRAERAKRNRIIGVIAVAAAVVLVSGLVVFLMNRDPESTAAPAEPQEKLVIPTERVEPAKRPKPLADPTKCTYKKDPQGAAKKVQVPKNGEVPAKGTVNATLETTAGTIGLTLDRALAPCTVNSIVGMIQQSYYDGTECHRLGTSGLQMLQCGDPTGSGMGGPGYTVQDENFNQLTYGRGILAMAKTSQPDSGGSQFFMVYGTAQLNPDYTVFGTIDDAGLKVLDKVARAGVDPAGVGQDGTGKPKVPVKFTKVTVQPDNAAS